MSYMFTNVDKYAKKIRKSQRLNDYEEAVNLLFTEQEIIEGAGLFYRLGNEGWMWMKFDKLK